MKENDRDINSAEYRRAREHRRDVIQLMVIITAILVLLIAFFI